VWEKEKPDGKVSEKGQKDLNEIEKSAVCGGITKKDPGTMAKTKEEK